MGLRIQVLSIALTGGLFVLVFELVRRRRLMERYALLWLFSTAILLMLAVWRHALEQVARGIGVYYPPSALFAIAFGFVLVLLLHFSLVISKLSDQSKVLAQQLGQLRQRVLDLEARAEMDENGLADARVIDEEVEYTRLR